MKLSNHELLRCLLCLFVLLIPAWGGASSWEFQGWYGGGAYPAVVFDPLVKGRVYLSSDVAGLWRSDNAGTSWKPMTKGLKNINVAAILPSPSVSNLVYAATENGLFTSTDGGGEWRSCGGFEGGLPFKRPDSYRVIAADPASPENIFVGTADGKALFSTDRCRSWSPLGASAYPFGRKAPINAIALTADRKYLLAGSSEGLARYSFMEKHWYIDPSRKPISDLVSSRVNNSLIWAASGSELLVSHDYASSWSAVEKLGQGKITRLAVSETGLPSFISFLWENEWRGGLKTSYDGGMSWRSADSNMTADALLNPTRAWADKGGRPLSVAIDPFNPAQILRTDWWGVWKSTDTGKSWHEAINGAANSVCTDLFTLENGDLLVSSMDNGLLRRNNRSGNYEPLFPTRGYAPDINGHVWRVLSLDSAGTRIVATSSPWGEKINQVLLSDNGGKSFRRTRAGLPKSRPRVNTLWGEGYPRALAVDPRNSNIIYLGIDGDDGGGLFISSDGGNTWAPTPAQPASKRIYSGLAVDQTDPAVLLWGTCGPKGGIYRSPDRGKNWSPVAIGCIYELVSTKEGDLYATGEQNGPAILHSNDHGVTWRALKSFSREGTAKGFSVNPANPNMLAVSVTQWNNRAEGVIYLSRDRGKTWKEITGGLPNGVGAVATTFSKDGKFLYIGRYAGSVYRFSLVEPH